MNEISDAMADFVELGDRFTVILPDGTQREVIVMATYKGGSVDIDFPHAFAVRLVKSRAKRR